MMTYATYEEAAAACGPDEKVSFTGRGRMRRGRVELEPGTQAVYFCVAADATADEVRDATFEMKYGKPMDGYQRFLLEQARTECNSQ